MFKSLYCCLGWQLKQLQLLRYLAIALALSLLFLTPKAEANPRYAAIVMDVDSGRVVYESGADSRKYPASLTKMMTLYLVFDALETGKLSLNDKLRVSKRAAGMPPSKLGLKAGSRIRVEDAVYALVTKSANDVAVVLAEHLAGSEIKFARIMTNRAHQLGMSRTTFRNASGLPDSRQVSTARDMARLSVALIRDFPQHYKVFSTKSFSYGGRTYRNHNKLLKTYSGVDGIKTGYIRASGFNLAASAERNGRRVVAVVFGGKTSRSRNRHVADLLDRGFKSVVALRSLEPSVLPAPRPVLVAKVDQAPRPATRAAEPQQIASITVEEPTSVPEEMGSTDGEAVRGGYGVQVGAFSKADHAERAARAAAEKASSLLDERAIRVTPITNKKSTLYRARLIGLTEELAREACGLLKSKGQDCLVFRVREPVDLAFNAASLSSNAN